MLAVLEEGQYVHVSKSFWSVWQAMSSSVIKSHLKWTRQESKLEAMFLSVSISKPIFSEDFKLFFSSETFSAYYTNAIFTVNQELVEAKTR